MLNHRFLGDIQSRFNKEDIHFLRITSIFRAVFCHYEL